MTVNYGLGVCSTARGAANRSQGCNSQCSPLRGDSPGHLVTVRAGELHLEDTVGKKGRDVLTQRLLCLFPQERGLWSDSHFKAAEFFLKRFGVPGRLVVSV